MVKLPAVEATWGEELYPLPSQLFEWWGGLSWFGGGSLQPLGKNIRLKYTWSFILHFLVLPLAGSLSNIF